MLSSLGSAATTAGYQGRVVTGTSSLQSSLYSEGASTTSDNGSMPQPQLFDGRPTPAYGPQGAVAAAATPSRPQPQEVGLVGETVAIVSNNQDSRGEGRVGEDVDGSTPGHSSSRSDSTEDVDVDVDVDVDGIEDESSTASGTSVAEEGWDSGHGLDNEEA
ncbi:unnamed protein product, partial [Laminaria digitata]